MDHVEAVDMIDEVTAPNHGNPELAFLRIAGIAPSNPSYVEGLRQIRDGIENMATLLEDCTPDCTEPTCISAPVHQKLIRDTDMEAAIANLRAAALRAKAALVDVVVVTTSCDCPGCQPRQGL
jgi:hypothetical protein